MSRFDRKPLMTEQFTLIEYRLSGCFQFEVPTLAVMLYQHTDGRMCNGCPKYEQGCASLQKMLMGRKGVAIKPAPTETVHQEAARLGLSIGEVRRRRNNPESAS